VQWCSRAGAGVLRTTGCPRRGAAAPRGPQCCRRTGARCTGGRGDVCTWAERRRTQPPLSAQLRFRGGLAGTAPPSMATLTSGLVPASACLSSSPYLAPCPSPPCHIPFPSKPLPLRLPPPPLHTLPPPSHTHPPPSLLAAEPPPRWPGLTAAARPGGAAGGARARTSRRPS
jgi:hypothetical protein